MSPGALAGHPLAGAPRGSRLLSRGLRLDKPLSADAKWFRSFFLVVASVSVSRLRPFARGSGSALSFSSLKILKGVSLCAKKLTSKRNGRLPGFWESRKAHVLRMIGVERRVSERVHEHRKRVDVQEFLSDDNQSPWLFGWHIALSVSALPKRSKLPGLAPGAPVAMPIPGALELALWAFHGRREG